METIKLSVAESITLIKVIEKIIFKTEGNQLVDRTIPANLRYKLQRLHDLFEKDYNFFEEQRVAIIKELGTQDEEGNTKVADDKMEEFKNKLMDKIKIQVSHNVIKITPEDMLSLDMNDITSEEMSIFMHYLIDDPDLTKDMETPIN